MSFQCSITAVAGQETGPCPLSSAVPLHQTVAWMFPSGALIISGFQVKWLLYSLLAGELVQAHTP